MLKSRDLASLFAAGVAVTTLAAAGAAQAAASLWFGNDGAGIEYHTDLNGNVLGTVNQSITGVAWTGQFLYMGDPGGNVYRKDANGAPVPGGDFTTPVLGSPAEDMASFGGGALLARVYHFNGTSGSIQAFDLSGNQINSAALLSTDPTGTLTAPMGAIGLAFDSKRDQFDVSFCNNGCGALGGVVEAYDAATLAYVGTLFTTTSSYYGGLGYDPATDTLWVGGDDAKGVYVEHVTRTGSVLSRFGGFGVFPDGLEFIPDVPEPSAWALMLVGLAGLGAALRTRRREIPA